MQKVTRFRNELKLKALPGARDQPASLIGLQIGD
jgi:hypothetical protein